MDVIYQWFQEQVIANPHAIALHHHHQTMTYGELHAKASAVAFALQAAGVKPDSFVAVCLPRTFDQLIAIFGILMAGGAYAPLDVLHQDTRLEMLLRINHIRWVVTSKQESHRFNAAQTQVLCVETISSQKTTPTTLQTPLQPQHLAYMIHTSGSTGTPKGVLIEQQSVINYCHWFQQYTSLQPGYRIDYSSHYTFDMAITTYLLPLLIGCSIILCDDEIKQNPKAYLNHLKNNQIQLVKLTPSYLKLLLQALRTHPIELPALTTLILGGENLPTADCQEWLKQFPHHMLFNEYGPSETTIGVTQYCINQDNVNDYQPNIPIGRPAPHVIYQIRNTEQQPVAPGEIGELYLGGTCLSRGYHGQPTLTAEKFIYDATAPITKAPDDLLSTPQRLYKTGDLCKQNKAGILEYYGRVDRQIKIRGYRVELGEIEHCLRQHTNIQDAVVVVSNHQTLYAYYITKKPRTLPSYTELRRYLLNFLPHYMIPNHFMMLDKFPLTANGKLDEKALPAPHLPQQPLRQKNRGKLEQQLIEIWMAEFELAHVDSHDNFYALGGHSLHAARIVSAIDQILHKKITLAEFYQAETIAELTLILKKRKRTYLKLKQATDQPIKKTTRSYLPPLFKKKFVDRQPLSDFQLLLWLTKTFEPKACQLNLVSRRRVQGQIDFNVLQHAFLATLSRHDIFQHHIAKTYPAYLKKKWRTPPLFEIDLSHLDINESESILVQSLQVLTQTYPWPKDYPLAMLKIFYLSEQHIELQLCIPHLIADEISTHLFWQDLSHYYVLLLEQNHAQLSNWIEQVTPAKPFHDYVQQEQARITTDFEKDCQFWRTYLDNSALFVFSRALIVRDMKEHQLTYSTYHPFPHTLLLTLHEYCVKNHLSIEDMLCAAVDHTLRTITNHQAPCSIINMIKSTREDRAYDNTIGCFLRVDPIKIEKTPHRSLLDSAKQIRQNALNHASFSQASTILKLAFLAAKNSQQKKTSALKMILSLYCLFLNKLRLEYKVLQLGVYFSSFKRADQFIIYMNLWQNFITPLSEKTYFGLPHHTTPMGFHDLSAWDNLCDISFVRDEHLNQPYVVVSSNLLPKTREQIAQTICHLLDDVVKA